MIKTVYKPFKINKIYKFIIEKEDSTIREVFGPRMTETIQWSSRLRLRTTGSMKERRVRVNKKHTYRTDDVFVPCPLLILFLQFLSILFV